MKKLFLLLKGLLIAPLGHIASSSFLICAVSGIFIAIPYKVGNPFDSISLMLLDNPAAVLLRNIHYWSAQFFLVFTILHLVDHFLQKTEYNTGKGVWLRLTLSLPVIFFVMISGFLLKGDGDSASAYQILASLLERIPWAGHLLKISVMGSWPDLQIIYVHHIATATIILTIVIVEHSRVIWPPGGVLIILLFIFILMGAFFHAPFGLETGKGPWYFLGFQEILHWSPRAGWTWLIILFVLSLFWLAPRVGFSMNSRLKSLLFIILVIYLLLTITGAFFRGENWQWKWPGEPSGLSVNEVPVYPLTTKMAEFYGEFQGLPKAGIRYEGCLVCHAKTAGFAPSHHPSAVGCFACHGGNPYTLNKNAAHRGMTLIPGNLEDAMKSCGTTACHPDISLRVPRSIMSTMSGVVTIDRYVFGEYDSLSALFHIADIGHTAADQHLRDLCANCHLGNPKSASGPVSELTRGGGCNACHLVYDSQSLASHLTYREELTLTLTDTFYHPRLSLNISDEHCFGCHSRSGRISTSYAGWHETLWDRDNLPEKGEFRILEDQRVFEFIRADVHHEKGLLCIDCHTSYGLMGDGNAYAHKEQQVKIRCEDCHFADLPQTVSFAELDLESQKILALRKWKTEGRNFVVGSQNPYALVNVMADETGNGFMRLKSKDTLLALKKPVAVCINSRSHQSLGCESCHTAWVPQCLGCHNAWDPKADGYDLLESREKLGSWVEYTGRFFAEPPTLGVLEAPGESKQVKTFTPGMILSIDQKSYPAGEKSVDPLFHRLFAPVSAHTTIREGRSCRSCHLDPLAIGYGRGELSYDISSGKGEWKFTNRFAQNPNDRLPEDAWTGFLSERKDIAATREHARPFNLREQRAILMVGACLTCHEENSEVMQESLEDFPSLLKKISKRCILPDWN